MGMTHTTLENQTFQLPSPNLPPSSTSTKYLSVKTNPTLSLSPIIEEPSEYSSDCYEYNGSVSHYNENGRKIKT